MVGSLSFSSSVFISLCTITHDTHTHTQSCLAEALAVFVVLVVDTAAAATTAAVFVVVVVVIQR